MPSTSDVAASTTPTLARVVELLEAWRVEGLHLGAQVYVSVDGDVLLDTAVGESIAGRALEPDDVMLWYSSGKPWTTVAVLQLWEQGRLGLDDPIRDYVDGWGNGKERATVRHVLTHTGGFPMPGDRLFDQDLTWDETVAGTAATRASWEPGTLAGYHPASGWRILGAVVQAVDGRRIDEYVRDEVALRIGTPDCRLGVPLGVQRELGERIAPVYWTGHRLPALVDGAIEMKEYRIDRIHNEPWWVAKIEPGGGMRGPARDLGRFYESLLGFGTPLLAPRTIEVMGAVHRWGIKDQTFGSRTPWGLGVQVDFTGGTGHRTFGHGGMASSRGLADPETGLVLVMVANGLAGYFDNERRNAELTSAVYDALGPEVQHLRRPGETQDRKGGISY